MEGCLVQVHHHVQHMHVTAACLENLALSKKPTNATSTTKTAETWEFLSIASFRPVILCHIFPGMELRCTRTRLIIRIQTCRKTRPSFDACSTVGKLRSPLTPSPTITYPGRPTGGDPFELSDHPCLLPVKITRANPCGIVLEEYSAYSSRETCSPACRYFPAIGFVLGIALVDRCLLGSFPQADGADGREGEQDTIAKYRYRVSYQTNWASGVCLRHLPQSDAQSPDRLHFEAGGFGRADPLGVVDLATFVQAVSECRCEVIGA